MTNSNSNLTPQQEKDLALFNEMISKRVYSITESQYVELNRLAASYESLCSLIPVDSDDCVSSISCLLDNLNSSFFEFIETFEPQQ